MTRRARHGGTAPGRSRPARPLVWRPGARPEYDGPLLLDTHLWVWMLDPEAGALPPSLVPLLHAAASRTRLYVSDIAFWEVGQKIARAKLRLTLPVSVWAARATSAPGVQYLPADRDVLLTSTALTTMHGDPADRILVATAKLAGVPLATLDHEIIEWAQREGATPICDCR